MFKKLKTKFVIPEFLIGDEVVHFGGTSYSGIWFNEISMTTNIFFSVIPERYRKDFKCRLMQIRGPVSPHTDSDMTVTINFYFSGTGGVTIFYDKPKEVETYQIENQTNGFMFDKDQLKFNSVFSANIGDAYVLDITKPHEVTALNSDIVRKALVLHTSRYSYEEVLKMLSETGNL